MNVNYTYTIASVSADFNSMAVLYSCSECDDITVDMPIPVSAAQLEDHIQANAPLEYWALQLSESNPPAVGATGVLSDANPEGESMIEYTYEVLSVDSSNKSMLVVYKSSGLQDITVGVRTPFTNETLDDVIRMYAPVANWREANKEYTAPAVGTTGALTADVNIYGQEPVIEESTEEDVADVISVNPLSV